MTQQARKDAIGLIRVFMEVDRLAKRADWKLAATNYLESLGDQRRESIQRFLILFLSTTYTVVPNGRIEVSFVDRIGIIADGIKVDFVGFTPVIYDQTDIEHIERGAYDRFLGEE